MKLRTPTEIFLRAEAFGEDFNGSPCLVLPNVPQPDGYVRVSRSGNRMEYAHRVVYEGLVGPIPDGMTIDHRCARLNGICGCVNPQHMEVVSMKENVLRSSGPAALNARKSACLAGHALAGENLYVNPTTGHRYCRACLRVYRKTWRERREIGKATGGDQ